MIHAVSGIYLQIICNETKVLIWPKAIRFFKNKAYSASNNKYCEGVSDL